MMKTRKYKYQRPILWTFLVIGLIYTRQLTLAQNYSELDGPKFSGNYAKAAPSSTKSLKVVSYNIKYAQNISIASQELEEIKALANADIILLQEMDEVGTEQLARRHGYNFVYFPAAIHPLYNQNFGNAILSKWPIQSGQKLILPHKSLTRTMIRQATKATISAGGTEITVYSIHAETAISVPRYRWNQYTHIINDIEATTDHVIVGGDFNTVTETEVASLEKKFNDIGLTRASNGIGHTVTKLSVDMAMDHIFTKGFSVTSAGKTTEAAASDHWPIWVNIEFQ